jgi:hypothetical protein
MLVTKIDLSPSVFLFLLCRHGTEFGRRIVVDREILLTGTFGEAISSISVIINEKLSIKCFKYCPPDSGEDYCLIPIVIPNLYHNAIRLPSKCRRSKETHRLVPRSLQCHFLCICRSFRRRPWSIRGWSHQLPSSYLDIATQGYFVRASCDIYCLLYEEVAAEATPPTQEPPYHREFVPAKGQKVVMFARLQGTLW